MGLLAVFVKVCVVLLGGSLLFCLLVNKEDSKWLIRKPLLIMVFAFPLAYLAYSIWFVMLLLFVLLPTISRTRGEAAGLYIVTVLALPIMNQRLGISSSTIITLNTYMAVTAGLLLCGLLKRGDPPSIPVNMQLPVLALLMVEVVGSARGLNATSVARTVIEQTLAVGLPYYALTRCISNPKDLRRVLVAFCFAATVQGILAVYEARMTWPIYEGLQRTLGSDISISQATKIRAGFMRANGTLPESTSFSWVLTLALSGVVCIRRAFRSTGHLFIAIALLCFGLLACQARAGWLAAALSIVLISIYQRRLLSATISLTVFSMIYGISALLKGYSDRLADFAASGTETYNYRLRLLHRGIEEISKHPILGTDLSTAIANLQDLRQGEGIVDFVNAYIYVTLVTGVVGLCLFVGQFLFFQFNILKLRSRLGDHQADSVGAWVFASSVATMVTSYTSGFGGTVIVFYMFVLAVGSRLGLLLRKTGRTSLPVSQVRRRLAGNPLESEEYYVQVKR